MENSDLTKGKVVPVLIRYAVPMIVTSLFQSVYSIVDVVIVGNYIGGEGISAINNASLVMNLITQIIIGLTVGGNVLISQYFGAGENEGYKKAIGTLFVLCMVLGTGCTALFYILGRPILMALGAPALELCVEYFKTCTFGMVFIFGYNALSATFRGLGNSGIPMKIIISSSCLNVLLDIIFVVFLGKGVKGAAFGTVLAQTFSFLLALLHIFRQKEIYGFMPKYLKFCPAIAGKIVKLGFPIALQWTVASISWLAVAHLVNRYGVVVSAGNGVSNKIKDFCQLFISAMVSAASTMAAQNIGAGLYERAKKIMQTCMVITIGLAVVMIVLVEFGAPVLVAVFPDEELVAGAAVLNLRIEIIAQVFYAGFMTFNVLATGAGDTMFVMANSFLNCIVVRLILAFVLEYFIGKTGIYLACMIAPASSVPVGYWYYKSNKWKHNVVRAG